MNLLLLLCIFWEGCEERYINSTLQFIVIAHCSDSYCTSSIASDENYTCDCLFVLCMQTIGAAFGAKKVSVQGESVTLGIWVGGGQRNTLEVAIR